MYIGWRMKLPTVPDEHGHSKGVRQRVERSFPAVRAAFGFRDVVKEALERKFGERLARLTGHGEMAGDAGRERYLSFPDFLLCVGRDIETKRDAMVRADLELEARRRARRQTFAERDRLKRKLYDARVRFKKEARRKLGKRWRVVLALEGETVRDPMELTRQAGHAVHWASGPNAPRVDVLGRPVDWASMAAPMAPLIEELDATMKTIAREDAWVIQALADRITTMEAFDDGYAKGARTLESTYVLLGLPTLATVVRPHLKVAGRVGRPSKHPPVDDYPDLVDRVRAAGLLPAAEPVRELPTKPGERHRLAIWIAAYRQAVVPYLTFLAGLSDRRHEHEGSASATGPRSAAAWPARALARWRQRGAS